MPASPEQATIVGVIGGTMGILIVLKALAEHAPKYWGI